MTRDRRPTPHGFAAGVFVLLLLGHSHCALGQTFVPNTIQIFETSGSTQASRPVSVPRPFRQGEIMNYAQASVDGAPVLTQCDVKNRWPDGSLKFAIVSFVIPNLPARGSVTVSFSNQTTGNNSGFLTQQDMLGASFDFDATIQMDGAVRRTVSAAQMVSGGYFRYWLQGPIVTAAIIEDRTPARAFDQDFGDGSKALHPIFEAWFYPQSGAVKVGYTIENTWASYNSSIGMRDLSYALTLRSGARTPTTEFTYPTFNHIGKSRWHKRFWIGADPPSIRIDHNLAYLVTTRLIPNYDTALRVAESLISAKYSDWLSTDKTITGGAGSAGDLGSYNKGLGVAGSNMWIGLMNTWDIIYLMTMDDRMLEMVVGNGDLAGRMPMHFREADVNAGTGDYFDVGKTVGTFGRMISVNARKLVTLMEPQTEFCGSIGEDKINTGTISDDGWGIVWRDHMPEVAYIPYLITGEYYFLEELQYWASYVVGFRVACYGSDWTRQGEAGYLQDSQTRGDAWGFRTLTYGACFSPDGSPEKAYFEDKLLNNLAMWEGAHDVPLTDRTRQAHWDYGHSYVMPPTGASPLGFWAHGNTGGLADPVKLDGTVLTAISSFEFDFLASAMGMARQFGYPTDALLRFCARRLFNQLLNPATVPYIVEVYRVPGLITATNDWVRTWSSLQNYYSTIPTAWRTGEDVDHGYGYVALGTLSFLYDLSVDGYTGRQAWDFLKANKPGQDRFATESPKWDMLPWAAAGSPSDPTPPSRVSDLRVR
jgi:hypothetical protein